MSINIRKNILIEFFFAAGERNINGQHNADE